MAATYTPGGTDDISVVRFKIGDTEFENENGAGAKFQDAEITALVTSEGSVDLAIAACFDVLAAKAAGQFDFSADGASFKKGSLHDHYVKQARIYRVKGRGVTVRMPVRVDGYSTMVAADAVDLTSSQFDETCR